LIALLTEPWLVLPSLIRSFADIPLEFDKADGSMEIVLIVFVNTEVPKVTLGESCVAVESVKNTRAKPGALTGTLQAFAA
jgi:hypothetical protein